MDTLKMDLDASIMKRVTRPVRDEKFPINTE